MTKRYISSAKAMALGLVLLNFAGRAEASFIQSFATVYPGAFSGIASSSASGTNTATKTVTTTFGAATFTGTGTSNTGYGLFKNYATVNLTGYTQSSYETKSGNSISGPGGPGTPVTDPVLAGSIVSDSFTITGGSGTGYLKLNFAVTGTTSMSTNVPSNNGPIAQGDFTIFKGIYGSGQIFVKGFGFTGNTSFSNAGSLIQFTYGTPFDLSFTSDAFIDPADYATGATYFMNATADFGSTITLSNLSVFTDTGGTAPVSSFTVGAGSGTNYPTSASAVPEPGTWLLTAIGLGGALLRRRRAAAA